MGCFPTVIRTYIHGWCWDGRWQWRLRWFRAVLFVVILCLRYNCPCIEVIKGMGRHIQVVQAWWDNRELPSKSIWHGRLIGIVIYCEDSWFWGCYWRYWGHPCRVLFGYLGWVENIGRIVSLWTKFTWALFHIETSESSEAIEIFEVNLLIKPINWWSR